MNNPILLSIIIPFYNVEQYIAQCLESVFNQNIQEEQYEVICVNDGSPDNSRDIVLEYQKRHKNLILIEHEINKKLGAARNTGRGIARGKYIWNVDSDDYIQPNCLNDMLRECEENELDVLMFNFDHLIAHAQTLNKAYPFLNSEVCTGIAYIKKYALGNFHEISPVWTQLYRKDFLDKNNIYSPPINMGEDVPYTFKALLLAERIRSITKSCYVYRMNEASLGGKIETIPSAISIYEKSFECSYYLVDVISLIPKEEREIKLAYESVVKYIIPLYKDYYSKMDKMNRKNFVNLCRKNFFRDFRKLCPYMTRRVLVSYICLLPVML